MISAGARGLIVYPTLRQGQQQDHDYLRTEDLGVPLVLLPLGIVYFGRAFQVAGTLSAPPLPGAVRRWRAGRSQLRRLPASSSALLSDRRTRWAAIRRR